MSISTQPLEEKKPIRCLVVQMARLGDSLQSLMALRAAKQLYPQLEIHFLCRENFAQAARRTPWLKSVFTFPNDEILGPVLRAEKDSGTAIREIARWLGPVIETPWEYVINWTYSEATSFLTALIPGRIKLGYTRRKDSSFLAADGWSHYIQGIVQEHTLQNIHLTDILTTQLLTALQIHIGDPMPNGDSPVTSKAFFSLPLQKRGWKKSMEDPTKKWIGIQLEKISPETWSKVASYVLQRNPEWHIVLLGKESERTHANEIFKSISIEGPTRSRIISLAGETDFDQWAAVVSRCQWLFSGDTAALHLASVLGTRVLNISDQPVFHIESGPYGNGHYVLAPQAKATPEERMISAEAIYAVWTYACQEWVHRRQVTLQTHFAQLGWGEHLQKLRAYRSVIRNTQDGGGVSYEPLTQQPLEIQEWTSMVIGHIARAWYCGWVPPMGHEIKREAISPALVKGLRSLQEAIEVLSKICEQATHTADQLYKKGTTLKSEKLMGLHDREELRVMGGTLLELETLMERVTKAQPQLKAFSQMAKVLMHNLKGNQLAELGKETASCYKRINEGITLFNDWVSHTLDLVKPVSVPTSTVRPIGREPSP